MLTPYPFQTKIINDCRAALKAGYNSPLIVSPTGSGKTLMYAVIAQGAMQREKKVLILAHRIEIIEQILSKLFAFGMTAGQIVSGRPMTRNAIQVAMINTIVRRLNKLSYKPDLIITDECHHSVSPTYKTVIKHFGNVPHIGATATPRRLDGIGLGDVYDVIIQGPTISTLVKENYLSYPIMYRPPKEIIQKYHLTRGDFDQDEQFAVMKEKTIVGDVIAHYQKYLNYKPVVCFCVSVKHSELMADAFRNAGYVAVHVHGGMRKSDRETAIKGLANGSIHILTSCDLISEGVDIPVMAGAILLRRTMSLSLYLQQVGRPLRKYEGKQNTIILDHANNYALHGHVLADRQWTLDSEKHTPRNENPPTTTSCPKCFGIWPGEPRVCPSCGFSFADNPKVDAQQRKTPKEIAGELIAALPEAEQAKIIDMTEFIQRVQTFEPDKRRKALLAKAYASDSSKEIDALATAIGYKKGWTDYIWKNVLKRR
jgi:DNA repair protein RadD